MRNQTIILTLLLLIFGHFNFNASAHPEEVRKAGQPNIVVIFCDDLGYGDLSSYGNPTIKTPSLDKMANEGMKFTQFYAAASVCTPSRAGLLTGRYPIRTGMVKGYIPGRVLFPNDQTGLAPEEVTIAEVLKQKDYATMAVGKWHLGHLPEFLPTAQGFDGYYGIPYSNDMDYVGGKDGKEGYWNVPLMRDTTIIERPAVQETLTKRYTEEAIKFIEQNKKGPFFLYLAHSMPHIPLFASDDFHETSARGLYGDVISEIDWSVGEILSTLKKNKLGKNTLVIFTSDNGPWLVQKYHSGSAGPLREGKGTTWEGGMREPMIAWWPEHIPEGTINTGLATTLDLLPTFASLAETSLPETKLDGYDISPLLKNENAESPRETFLYYRDDEIYAIRKGPWKAHFYTQTEYPAGPLVAHNPPLLYQLEHDFAEQINVAEAYPEVVKELTEEYERSLNLMGLSKLPAIEAEEMIDDATTTGGKLRVQKMSNFKKKWGNDQQLWWVEARPGDRLSLPLEVVEKGTYELLGFFTRAGDYGIIKLHVNGKELPVIVDGYANGLVHTGPVSFGKVELDKGTNNIEIELIGKDYRSSGYSQGYLVGIDGFTLRK